MTKKNKEPIALAGLWSEWKNPKNGGITTTFSIVTTKGNELMAKIHNNPKIKEPRMPLILPEHLEDKWLKKADNEFDKVELQQIIIPYSSDLLKSHTVRKLRGKSYTGNIEEISNEFIYPDLEF